MVRDDDDVPWTRQLLLVLGVLVAVALVIGGVVSVVALGAAKVSGIGSAGPSATSRPSLYMPSGEPTTSPEAFPAPENDESGSASPSPSESPTQTPTEKTQPISLQAFPQRASANERVNLTGVYQGGEGSRLQVQRFEGGAWVDFPVSASVTGGSFTTYIYTGHTGLNRFRVLDQASGKKSNPVKVTIG